MTIKVGIYGARGYTGLELVRLLSQHPDVELAFLTSEQSAGTSLRENWPQAPDLPLISAADAPLDAVQAVFLCLPHTASAPIAVAALEQGVKVVDLSADLRLDDPAVYQTWYKVPHPAPHLLPTLYGLPELEERERIAASNCIANPGCYAAATLLGLTPLARSGMIRPGTPIIVDAKSGTSGAGRAPKQNLLFAEVCRNFSPYNIGRAHRHLPEIEQNLAKAGLEPGQMVFSPHLLPTDRGILSTHYVQVSDAETAHQLFVDTYGSEPLVDVLAPGKLATLAHVVCTPKAVISLTPVSPEMLIVVVAIDNLLKGAASQAVQNFNLMWGLPETRSLL
ncbi:MAG: N-acetyl-gamma-glutamyl-phosphate reductase [Anaerolineae bacterium]|nr:N-acetyl-gamma-glutamyl-phosphate reductase [Anaerolineae bacterium]